MLIKFSVIYFCVFWNLINLTLRRPLPKKLRMRWFFDVSNLEIPRWRSRVFLSDLTDVRVNRYRTVCRLRAMRIFAPEFISENEELSRKRRGAKCPRGDTQSCGERFFPVLYRLKNTTDSTSHFWLVNFSPNENFEPWSWSSNTFCFYVIEMIIINN